MFGAEAASKSGDQIMHGALQRTFMSEESLAVRASALIHVEVQIPVTDMAIGHQESFWHEAFNQCRSLFNERWNGCDGYANIVLEAAAGMALSFGHSLAQSPQVFSPRVAVCDDCVEYQSIRQCGSQG